MIVKQVNQTRLGWKWSLACLHQMRFRRKKDRAARCICFTWDAEENIHQLYPIRYVEKWTYSEVLIVIGQDFIEHSNNLLWDA